MNYKAIFLFLFICSMFRMDAQNIQNYLPVDPAVVVHIKPSVLHDKVNIEELRTLPMVQNMIKGMSDIFPSDGGEDIRLVDLGIDVNRDMYVYVNKEEGGIVMAFLMNLLDEQKFAQSIAKTGRGGEGENIGGFLTVRDNENFISWGNGMAISGTFMKDQEPYDPYADMDWSEDEWVEEEVEDISEEEYIEETETEVEEILETTEEEVEEEIEFIDQDIVEEEIIVNVDPVVDVEVQKWMDEKLLMTLQSKSGLKLSKRTQLAKGKGVISAVLNYAQFFEMMTNLTGGSEAMGMDAMVGNLYSGMYNGMESFMDLQFNKGEMVMQADYTYPEGLTRGVDITKAKVNSKFRKYLKGDNLLGVYSIAMNPEGYGNMVKEMMLNAMDEMPETMGLGRDLAPILGVFIDEDAIYKFFKGDMIIAFTGLKTYEKTTTDYEYDEDFNVTEKTTTSEEQIPEFTSMVSIGDRENMQRILNIGKKTGALEERGDHYVVKLPLGFDLYLALKDDIFFLSNDTDLITQNLSSGLSSNKIDKQRWKNIKKNSFHFFWDVPSTLNMASEFGLPVGEETINMSRESIKEINWSAPRKQGNKMNSTMTMSFVNENENALKLILNFVNDLLFPSESKTSM